MADNAQNKFSVHKNILWIIATFVTPHLTYFVSAYILSLFWSTTRDIPQLGLLMSLDTVPLLVGMAASAYCFSEIEFSTWKAKLATLLAVVFSIFVSGIITAIYTWCIIFSECP